jgi:hypothetical protein
MFVSAKENHKGLTILRYLLLAASFALSSPACAADPEPAAAPAANVDRCAPFGEPASDIKSRMYAFEPTFGKDPMLWTDADYDAIARQAASCDGVVQDGKTISAHAWVSTLGAVKSRVYPAAVVNRTAIAYAASAKGRIKLPDCRRLIDYRVDPKTFVDTSNEMFGVDVFSMDDSEIDFVVGYANICRAVIPVWLAASKEMLVSRALEPVEIMMDRFLLVKMRRSEWKKMSADGLILALPNGAKIPPTMASVPVRELVTVYDQWSNSGFYQSPNSMSRLLTILEAADKKSQGPVDDLYVAGIRKIVQERLLK